MLDTLPTATAYTEPDEYTDVLMLARVEAVRLWGKYAPASLHGLVDKTQPPSLVSFSGTVAVFYSPTQQRDKGKFADEGRAYVPHPKQKKEPPPDFDTVLDKIDRGEPLTDQERQAAKAMQEAYKAKQAQQAQDAAEASAKAVQKDSNVAVAGGTVSITTGTSKVTVEAKGVAATTTAEPAPEKEDWQVFDDFERGQASSTQALLHDRKLLSAVQAYRTDAYIWINHKLRGTGEVPGEGEDFDVPDDNKVSNYISALDYIMEDAKAPMDIAVYRGGHKYGSKPGAVFMDKGFVSTSTDREIADEFGGTMMRIDVPKGSPALALSDRINPNEIVAGETEVLLPRNAQFKYLGTITLPEVQRGDHKLRPKTVPHYQYVGQGPATFSSLVNKTQPTAGQAGQRKTSRFEWAEGDMVEVGQGQVNDKGTATFTFNPAQLRGPHGKWADEGKGAQHKADSAAKKAQKDAEKAAKGTATIAATIKPSAVDTMSKEKLEALQNDLINNYGGVDNIMDKAPAGVWKLFKKVNDKLAAMPAEPVTPAGSVVASIQMQTALQHVKDGNLVLSSEQIKALTPASLKTYYDALLKKYKDSAHIATNGTNGEYETWEGIGAKLNLPTADVEEGDNPQPGDVTKSGSYTVAVTHQPATAPSKTEKVEAGGKMFSFDGKTMYAGYVPGMPGIPRDVGDPELTEVLPATLQNTYDEAAKAKDMDEGDKLYAMASLMLKAAKEHGKALIANDSPDKVSYYKELMKVSGQTFKQLTKYEGKNGIVPMYDQMDTTEASLVNKTTGPTTTPQPGTSFSESAIQSAAAKQLKSVQYLMGGDDDALYEWAASSNNAITPEMRAGEFLAKIAILDGIIKQEQFKKDTNPSQPNHLEAATSWKNTYQNELSKMGVKTTVDMINKAPPKPTATPTQSEAFTALPQAVQSDAVEAVNDVFNNLGVGNKDKLFHYVAQAPGKGMSTSETLRAYAARSIVLDYLIGDESDYLAQNSKPTSPALEKYLAARELNDGALKTALAKSKKQKLGGGSTVAHYQKELAKVGDLSVKATAKAMAIDKESNDAFKAMDSLLDHLSTDSHEYQAANKKWNALVDKSQAAWSKVNDLKQLVKEANRDFVAAQDYDPAATVARNLKQAQDEIDLNEPNPGTTSFVSGVIEDTKRLVRIHGLPEPKYPKWPDLNPVTGKKYKDQQQMIFPLADPDTGEILDPGRYDPEGSSFRRYDDPADGRTKDEEILISSYKDWAANLDYSEEGAVGEYTGSGYSDLNKYLRSGSSPEGEPFDEDDAANNFDTSQAESDYSEYNYDDDVSTFQVDNNRPMEGEEEFYDADRNIDYDKLEKAQAAWDEEHQEAQQEYIDQKQQEYVQEQQDEYVQAQKDIWEEDNGGGSDYDLDSMRSGLDAMFARDTTVAPENLMVFRAGYVSDEQGDSNDPSAPESWDVGTILKDDGFISTSLSARFARAWGSGGPHFAIEVPKGSKAAYLDAVSSVGGGEDEMLLPRGSKFVRMGDIDITTDSYGTEQWPRLRYLGVEYDPNATGLPAESDESTDPLWPYTGSSEQHDLFADAAGATGLLDWQQKTAGYMGPHKLYKVGEEKKTKPDPKTGLVKFSAKRLVDKTAKRRTMFDLGKDSVGDRFTWHPGDLKPTGESFDPYEPPKPGKPKPKSPSSVPQQPRRDTQRPANGGTGIPTPASFYRSAEWLSNALGKVANFYRPDQQRGFHGKWVDEGRAAAQRLTDKTVMDKKQGGAEGSNTGGFYKGADGVQRYVKEYDDPTQAHSEVLANRIYRALGINAPRAGTFESKGKTMYASEIVPGATLDHQLGRQGLTKERANGILDGFVADVLTANRDVLGMSMDNVLDVDGDLWRIDNGSAFLHRAQGARKDTAGLEDIGEWESLAPGGRNSGYASVFKAAGYDTPEDMGAKLDKQVDALKKLYDSFGDDGWEAFVDYYTPQMDPDDREAIIGMLESRTRRLVDKTSGAPNSKATKQSGLAAFYSPTQLRDKGKFADEGRAYVPHPRQQGPPSADTNIKPAVRKDKLTADKRWALLPESDREHIVSGVDDESADAKEPFVNHDNAHAVDASHAAEASMVDNARADLMSLDEYRAAVVKRMSELTSKARVVKRTHLSTIERILGDGRIKSQFETGVSSGYLDNDVRDKAEAAFFYGNASVPPKNRPIYGYLHDDPERKSPSKSVSWDNLSAYGDTDIVFKPSVHGRTTYTMEDSLDTVDGAMLGPAPLTHPNLRPYRHEANLLEVEHVQDAGGRMGFGTGYTEAQIHGGVTLDDIDYVLLPREDNNFGYASQENIDLLKKKLDAKGIKWKMGNLQNE